MENVQCVDVQLEKRTKKPIKIWLYNKKKNEVYLKPLELIWSAGKSITLSPNDDLI